MLSIESTSFRDLLVLQPKQFVDHRGLFFESFNEARFRIQSGLNITFVQDNISHSAKHVLRGLHFQVSPKSQAKLITVLSGSVLDVVVDLRRTEATFGQWFSMELSAANGKQLFIPEGFAHGFVALEENTIFHYKCSNYYSPDAERSLLWNDPTIGIQWPVEKPILADKDASAPSFKELDVFFF
ncbi:MAG: dTDP-4-dehydrorhamnose 3,5-epimerase [Flavobacteriales bacterium]